MAIKSIQEYSDMKSDTLPYKTSWGFTVTEVGGFCPNCKKSLSNMKYSVEPWDNFIIIKSVGTCQDCKLVVTCDTMKLTNENKFYALKNGQWKPMGKPSWYDRLKGFIKGENELV